MKILVESHQLFSHLKTGVGYYEQVLIGQLNDVIEDNDHELCLGAFKDSELTDSDNEIVVSKYSSRVLRKLLAYKIGIKPEKVWTQNFDAYIFPDYFLLPSRKKTAVTIHDLTFLDKPEYMADTRNRIVDFFYPGITTVLRRIVPYSISKADVVIAISETMREKLINKYSIDPSKVIAQGIPPSKEFTSRKITKPQGLEIPTKNFIYYQATLEPRKNHMVLLRAYRLLPEDVRKSTSLVLAGKLGWKYEETLNLIKKLQLSGENIVHLNYVDELERLYLYQHALFYIQPSHDEGFGMPLLEAMACHTPVLCSDIEIFHEVCEDASLYFDKDSPDSIAEIILKALENENTRNNLVKKGTQRVEFYKSDLSGIKKILTKLGVTIAS